MTKGPTFHDLTRLHPTLMLHLTAVASRDHVEIQDDTSRQVLIVLDPAECTAWIRNLEFRGFDAMERRCRLHGPRGRGGEFCTCAKVFRSRLFAATAKAGGARMARI